MMSIKGNILKTGLLITIFFLLVYSSNAFSLTNINLDCETIDCNAIAPKKIIEFKKQDGIDISVPRLFSFTITSKITNLTKLHKSIVLDALDKYIFVVSDVEIGDFGLSINDNITLSEFFKAIYLMEYSQLNKKEMSSNALIAIKAYKSSLRLSLKTNIIYFKVDSVSFYSFYDSASKTYEIHAISNSKMKFGQQVSLVGASEEVFFNFISSIKVK